MNLVSDLDRLQNQMRRLMDDMLHQLSPRFLLDQRIWSPQIDILETQESFLIIADVSGLDKDSIQITVKRNRVYLSGKRERPPINSTVRYLQMEIEYGTFERIFNLPVPVEESEIEAKYRDGLLTVTLPKKQRAKPQTIPVQSE
jgi:HSP20 family protein